MIHDTLTVEELRCQAEERLCKRQRSSAGQIMPSPVETAQLVHELQVHQIELELQNQALLEMRERLEENLEKYADLYHFAPVGYLLLDDHGTIREANLSVATLLGVNRCNLIDRRLSLFISLETRPTFNAFLDTLMAETAKESCEVTFNSETATPRYLHLEGVGVATGTGWQCRIAMTDITERKRMETALQDSQALLKTALQDSEALNTCVFNSHSDHLAVLDAQGVVISVNHAWLRFAEDNGAAAASIIGMNYLAVCAKAAAHPDSAEAAIVAAGIRAVLTGAQPEFDLEYPCHSPEERRWFHLHVVPLHGSRPGAVIAHRNITRHKQAEEALQREQRLLHQAERIAQFGSWEWEIERDQFRFSDGWRDIHGLPDRRLLPINELIRLAHPDDQAAVQTAFQNAQESQQSCEIEYRINRQTDQAIRWIRAKGEVIRNGQGQPVRMYGVTQDITEHQLLEKLQMLSRRLMAVQEEERRVLAYAFHEDFGQQLAGLKLKLSLLSGDLMDPVSRSRIADSVECVQGIINQVREIAHDLRPSVLDHLGLSAALHGYAQTLMAGNSCQIKILDHLPPLSAEVEIAVFRIIQAALNNAIDYGVAQQITVVITADEDQLRLLIQDNGRGFEPATISPLKPDGLISIRERIELLGGQQVRTSQIGVGTRIEATLPLIEARG